MNNGCIMNCTMLFMYQGSWLSACIMQIAKYNSHNHCLLSLSATRGGQTLHAFRNEVWQSWTNHVPLTLFAILLSFNQTQRYGSVCHNKTTTKFSLNSSKTRFSMSCLLWQQPGQLASFSDPAQLSIASSTVSGRGPGRKQFCLQQAMIACSRYGMEQLWGCSLFSVAVNYKTSIWERYISTALRIKRICKPIIKPFCNSGWKCGKFIFILCNNKTNLLFYSSNGYLDYSDAEKTVVVRGFIW